MYLIPLKRKVSRIEINRAEMKKLLSAENMKAFEVLSQEKNIIIKGGFAKILFGQILKNEGKIKKNRAVDNEWKKAPDIDLIFLFTGTKTKALPLLTEKIKHLIEELEKTNFPLSGRDIELIKGTPDSERIMRKVIETREMTINEVIAVPKEQGEYWLLYYTDKAYRDTEHAIGMISVNNPATIHYDFGRIRASYYGLTRLIRFLTEDKIKNIYLPKWWLERTKEKAKEDNSSSLGLYGAILAERYKEYPKLQKRFITILNDLKLTEFKDFKDYESQESTWFKSKTGKKFEVDKTMPFEDVQRKEAEKKERHMGVKQRRKQLQASCSHYVESFVCDYCPEQCKIKHCSKCNKLEITPKKLKKPVGLYELPCNKSFISAEFYWGKDAFYPKPPKA